MFFTERPELLTDHCSLLSAGAAQSPPVRTRGFLPSRPPVWLPLLLPSSPVGTRDHADTLPSSGFSYEPQQIPALPSPGTSLVGSLVASRAHILQTPSSLDLLSLTLTRRGGRHPQPTHHWHSPLPECQASVNSISVPTSLCHVSLGPWLFPRPGPGKKGSF